jgi:hypothetical protein
MRTLSGEMRALVCLYSGSSRASTVISAAFMRA